MYNITILNKLGLLIYEYTNINRYTDFRFSAYSHNSIFFEFLTAIIKELVKPFYQCKNDNLFGKNFLQLVKTGKNFLQLVKTGKNYNIYNTYLFSSSSSSSSSKIERGY